MENIQLWQTMGYLTRDCWERLRYGGFGYIIWSRWVKKVTFSLGWCSRKRGNSTISLKTFLSEVWSYKERLKLWQNWQESRIGGHLGSFSWFRQYLCIYLHVLLNTECSCMSWYIIILEWPGVILLHCWCSAGRHHCLTQMSGNPSITSRHRQQYQDHFHLSWTASSFPVSTAMNCTVHSKLVSKFFKIYPESNNFSSISFYSPSPSSFYNSLSKLTLLTTWIFALRIFLTPKVLPLLIVRVTLSSVTAMQLSYAPTLMTSHHLPQASIQSLYHNLTCSFLWHISLPHMLFCFFCTSCIL